jgi:hypothetical protein
MFIERIKERVPDLFQHALGLPFSETTPAGARRRKPLGQVTPTSTTTQHPQNAFPTRPIIGWWTTSFATSLPLRQVRLDLLPLFIADFDIVSFGHRKPPFDDRLNRSSTRAQVYFNKVLKPALAHRVAMHMTAAIHYNIYVNYKIN